VRGRAGKECENKAGNRVKLKPGTYRLDEAFAGFSRTLHDSHKIKQNKDLFAGFYLAESLPEEVK
jgi:hypothetical protein